MVPEWCVLRGSSHMHGGRLLRKLSLFIESPADDRTLAEAWDGSRWTIQPTPGPTSYGASQSVLNGVSCTSSTACTAVGDYQVNSPGYAGYRTLAETWNGTRWSVQPTVNPNPSFNILSAVSCGASTACMAVGKTTLDSGYRLLVEQWNGTAWSSAAPPIPPGAVTTSLSSISCAAATNCVAVGSYGDNYQSTQPLVERWDGTSWAVDLAPLPSGAKGGLLAGVSCAAIGSCMAVGYSTDAAGLGTAMSETWDGISWKSQATPNPAPGKSSSLNGVSCASRSSCTAAGWAQNGYSTEVFAARWEGHAWTIDATPRLYPSGGSATDVSCSASSACTLVGFDYPVTYAGVAERWNGTGWGLQDVPQAAGTAVTQLTGVSCVVTSSCIAVGWYTDDYSVRQMLTEAWDGSRWTFRSPAIPAGASQTYFYGVACVGTQCMAVGNYLSSSQVGVPLVEKWDGSQWSLMPAPSASGASGAGLTSVSCASAVSCTAVGSYYSSGVTMPLAEHWNGVTWSVQPTTRPAGANAAILTAVSCVSPTNCTAVGDYTTVNGTYAMAERWQGSGWVMQPMPNPPGAKHTMLPGLVCTTSTACTAVGHYLNDVVTDATLAEFWDGTSWTIQSTPSPGPASELTGESCTAANACTAVGFYHNTSADADLTLAETWNGTRWSVQPTPNLSGGAQNFLNAVSCATSTTCAAVGYMEIGYYTGRNVGLAERYA